MADPFPTTVQEVQTETPNDVPTKRNKTTREQYYGGYQQTTFAGSMSQ